MGNLVDYGKSELSKIEHDDEGMQDRMDKCVLDLLKLLSDQGHSNHTVHYCLAVFNRLAKFKPLTPLTGEDDEWNEVGNDMFQNKRYSAVFKEGKNGRAYNVEGKVFSNDGGETWYTSKDSSVYIDFPYTVPDKPEQIILNER